MISPVPSCPLGPAIHRSAHPSGNLGPVLAPLTFLIMAAATAQALWATWFVIKDRAVILKQLWGGAVVEGLLLVQVIVAAVMLATGDHQIAAGEFWGYLVTILIILPFAAAWAFAERTRWSSVVMVVAALTVVFLEWRLLQIWTRTA